MCGCGQCLRISSPRTNSVEVSVSVEVGLNTVCVDLLIMGVQTHFHPRLVFIVFVQTHFHPHLLFLHGNVHVYIVSSDHNGAETVVFLDKY